MRSYFILILAVALLPVNTVSAEEELSGKVKQLLDIPLTDLLKRQNINITSVSKKSERLIDAAAAVHVITNEDIRRSGATSFPEVLRLAPGIQVAQVDSNKWAISSRGLNAQLANKLLVLIDGRDVYTPLFSGVNWDVQDYPLEDIERIEVIRGSGATLWGANAVNGVINIITKSATKTPGTLVSGLYGNYEEGTLTLRQGFELTEKSHLRAYAKGFQRDESRDIRGQDANDSWKQIRGGFRMDSEGLDNNKITIQGDIYEGREDRRSFLPVAEPPFTLIRETEEVRRGKNLLLNLSKQLDSKSELSFKTFYDSVQRDNNTLTQNRDTFDIDFQHSWNMFESSQFIWGLGYRYIDDDFGNTEFISFDPKSRRYDIISGFAQNKFIIAPELLSLTVGSKVEHNDFTGIEVQPNIRLLWNINQTSSLWAAVSRSVRTPSRGEHDIALRVQTLENGAGFVQQQGVDSFESENLMSYELGLRSLILDKVLLDSAVFFNDYRDARTLEFTAPTIQDGLVLQSVVPGNKGKIYSFGVEFSSDIEVTPDWRVIGTYSFINLVTETEPGSTDSSFQLEEGRAPHNQFSVRSQHDLPMDVELDLALLYVDSVPSSDNTPSYFRFDARVGWSPYSWLDINLVGQNLFQEYHQEFQGPLHGLTSEIPQSYYLKITYLY